MNLHEYQAKQLLKEYKLPVPMGMVVHAVAEVEATLASLGGKTWVVKAEIHAGGRGKAGGVQLVSTVREAQAVAGRLLGKPLVTYQTDEKGQPVNQLLIEPGCVIAREYYLGAVIDRASKRLVFMASTEGGVEIEKVAQNTPEKILRITVDPLFGVLPYQARELGFALGFDLKQIGQLSTLLMGLGKLFVEKDLSLLEINPLVLTESGDLLCLDAKINIDDNALYRQPILASWRDKTQENARENTAKEWDLNYISLEGNIGCMVNGAGLAMATMDLIKLHGGEPANFLDVGGTATEDRVAEAFKIILSDQQVKAVLVNIFGGIVRCDLIAEGIIHAVSQVEVHVPVVVRLEGNQAEVGAKKLAACGLNIIAAESLNEAAKKVVAAVKQ